MFTLKLEMKPFVVLVLLLCARQASAAEGPKLGRPASSQDIARWSLTVFPDGRGLPQGRGAAFQGKMVYEQHCASCHGLQGQGGSADELAGARHGLVGPSPDKTVGTYWPYATTLFDFVRRSMPPAAPGSLSNDQLYAVCAYLLQLNGIIAEAAEMNASTLPLVRMPNREGFVPVDAKP
jgi:cytochrome c